MLVLQQLTKNWWIFVLQGIAAILFGLLAVAQPEITLAALVMIFAIWALADGVLALISSIGAAQHHEPWWPLVIVGILGVGAGLLSLRWPGITALTLLFVISFWSVFRGLITIVAAFRLRHEIEGELWLILSGIASLIFGVVLVIAPEAGAIAIVWLIGLYALIFGLILILLGFRLKSHVVPARK